MTDLEAALAAGAKPVSAGPAPDSDLAKALAAGAKPVSAGPAPQPSNVASTNAAIYHGIANGGTFGAGAAMSAGIDTAINKLLPRSVLHYLQKANEFGGSAGLPLDQDATYDQRRAAYAGDIGASAQLHPVAFAAGETAGGLTAGGSGVAAGDIVASKLGTGTAARLAGAATGGAVTGAEFGAGSAASQGLDPVEGAKLTGKSALLGGGTGLAMHGLGDIASAAANKASSALQDKYVKVFGGEVLGNASKKATVKSWSQILGKAPEEGVQERAAHKYVQSSEMAPVEAAARHGKYDQALEQIDTNLAKYRPGRIANYTAVDEAKPFEVGEGLNSIDRELFLATNKHKDQQAVKALSQARQEWVKDYSSADAGAIQRTLLHPAGVEDTQVVDQLRAVVDSLPQSGQVTRTDISKAVEESGAGPGALQYLNEHVLDPKQGLLNWNPKANIPAAELRQQATVRQQSALQAFDALNPNNSEHAKSVVKRAITGALEKHLDSAAATSPAVADVVSRIRNDDVKFSVLLAAKRGLTEQAEKAQRNELQLRSILRHALHVGTVPAGAYAGANANEAVNDVSEGKYGQALKHGAEAAFFGGIAGAGAYRGASIAHNRLTNSLPTPGPTSQGFIQMLQQRLPNAVTGTVTNTTLGQP